MAGPDLSSREGPYGRCRGDKMAIISKQQDIGLSQGNLLCGDMTGQHSEWKNMNETLFMQHILPLSVYYDLGVISFTQFMCL